MSPGHGDQGVQVERARSAGSDPVHRQPMPPSDGIAQLASDDLGTVEAERAGSGEGVKRVFLKLVEIELPGDRAGPRWQLRRTAPAWTLALRCRGGGRASRYGRDGAAAICAMRVRIPSTDFAPGAPARLPPGDDAAQSVGPEPGVLDVAPAIDLAKDRPEAGVGRPQPILQRAHGTGRGVRAVDQDRYVLGAGKLDFGACLDETDLFPLEPEQLFRRRPFTSGE